LRQPVTVHRPSADADQLIDAAIAVNDAPTLREAFQVLADVGLALLACDRMGVTEWDEALAVGTVVAAAGDSREHLGTTIESDEAIRDRLRDRKSVV
jgi:hypothetical protein